MPLVQRRFVMRPPPRTLFVDTEHVVEIVRLILAEPRRERGPIEAHVNAPCSALDAKRFDQELVEARELGMAHRHARAGRVPRAGLVRERELDRLGAIAHDRMK